MNRRQFLWGAGATGAALSAMGVALPSGAVPANDRKLIFVFAPGGWDVTRCFAPEFSNPAVAMEPDAEVSSKGGLKWVSHADRPSVDLFFQNNHDQALVVNGMMVRSIAHQICTMITLTGTSSGLAPDWPAIIANQNRTDYTLPHLVISGPSFPGDLGVAVARSGLNGQLEALVSGQVETWSSIPVQNPDRVDESLIDRYLMRRSAARASSSRSKLEAALSSQFDDSMRKVGELKGLRYSMDFTASTLLEDQARVAVDALSNGVSRCVTIAAGTSWDTHANNDQLQSPLWESLFGGLLRLKVLLESTPGHSAATMADETLVVVLSEMARTPMLNDLNGKDHWPYTSALLFGPGITGDRVVGGFDDTYYGLTIDPATAEPDPNGTVLSAEMLGATLLQYAGVDPDPFVSGVSPITGVLS